MLTASEAADVPAEMAQQKAIASLGLTINQYSKTLQGRQMIESGEPFVLGERLYQGYGQRAVEPTEDQLTDAEFEGAHDIDGSKHMLAKSRARRMESAVLGKKRELANRRKAEVATERDELELMLLKRRLAKEEAEPEAEPDPEPEQGSFVCDAPGCDKSFPSANKLRGHRVGAKH